ncbi:MAG: hypothetical protein IKZ19_00865 [Clostridia bacterium]|nr:hypothetical protein [Clostridia bacterium]
MKKRILKISAFAAALVLIVGVMWFANGLVGNPVSKALATRTAKNHLEENYPGEDFELDGVVFSFKHGYYHVYITSPGSIDSSFSLAIGLNGKLISDYYGDLVLSGWNTAERIGREYRLSVDGVLNSSEFPYNEHIGYGELEFVPAEYKNDPSVPEYAIVTEELVPDAFYDVDELGKKAGKITVYLEDENVTYERLAEIVLDIRRIFDDAGVSFWALDLVLESPKTEDGYDETARVEVMDFLYSDIYEEGMTERVISSDEAADAYYAEQDGEKLKEKAEEGK